MVLKQFVLLLPLIFDSRPVNYLLANLICLEFSHPSIKIDDNYILSGSSTNGTGVWTTSGDGTFTNTYSATSDYTPGAIDILNGTLVLTWTVTGTAPIALACNSATSSMTLN